MCQTQFRGSLRLSRRQPRLWVESVFQSKAAMRRDPIGYRYQFPDARRLQRLDRLGRHLRPKREGAGHEAGACVQQPRHLRGEDHGDEQEHQCCRGQGANHAAFELQRNRRFPGEYSKCRTRRPNSCDHNTSITTKSLKGKFNFSGSKTDTVTYSGSIQLPAGITQGQPHEFWIGIGNIIVTTTLDKNGKGSVPGSPGILKSLKVTSKLKKGQTSVGGEPATVTCTYSTMAMVANGFDTEGISKDSTDLPKGKSTSRMIQVAMLLDGSPFQALAPVNFSKSGNSDLGTISGRSSKP